MDSPPEEDITLCLKAMREGDAEAADRLLSHLYDKLRGMAGTMFRRQGPDQTLQPTALVHEAYLKLVGSGDYNDRAHFFNVAAKAMRQIMSNRARGRDTEKRGGNFERVEMHDNVAIDSSDLVIDMASLNEVLQRLEATDPRLAEVFQLRYLSGLGTDEVAEIVGRAPRTVRLDCKMALAWIRGHLEDGTD